ncbi:MAG TPA: PQQ-binding-like beta-propeller repeat protein [Promineifilum sp.]|nr:PQQ-binding-like beta-propeller repeat protein [Promineifilum sp.]HRO88884.1 PQQ-binding-like beta-propeller repeat protein [Promineifilum sp.]HRQ11873.1 PQQ-binding-like beta-propeller repeat protein [Promineifilum sp.]
MQQLRRPLRRPALWLLIIAVGVMFLTACSGRIANTNWAGLSTDGSLVYLAFGPRVLAYDPATQTRQWIYPAEADTVQFYSAPSAEEGQVVFGDYGRAGGFLSPRVTVSIYALGNANTNTPKELWINSSAATDRIVAPPLQVGDQVYVGTADNHILALNAKDGSVTWDYEAGHAIWGKPSFRDGILYINSMDWSVYALHADTGELLWKTRLGGALAGQAVLGDDLLYVSSFDGNVHALEIASGEVKWSAPASGWVWGAPAFADGVIYYSDIEGNIHAADAESGAQRWTQSTGNRIQTAPVVVGDTLYIASQNGGATPSGALTAYSTADGTQKWSQPTSAPLLATPVVVGEKTIVVGLQNADALLIGFDLATGQELWRYSLPESDN